MSDAVVIEPIQSKDVRKLLRIFRACTEFSAAAPAELTNIFESGACFANRAAISGFEQD
jgi:hypothetical protein